MDESSTNTSRIGPIKFASRRWMGIRCRAQSLQENCSKWYKLIAYIALECMIMKCYSMMLMYDEILPSVETGSNLFSATGRG